MNEGTGREHYASSQTDRGRKAAVWNCTSFTIIFQNASASQRFSRSRCSRFHVQKCWGNKPCISLTIQRLDNIIVNKQLHRSKLQHEQIDDVEPPAGPLCKGFVGHCTSGHLSSIARFRDRSFSTAGLPPSNSSVPLHDSSDI